MAVSLLSLLLLSITSDERLLQNFPSQMGSEHETLLAGITCLSNDFEIVFVENQLANSVS